MSPSPMLASFPTPIRWSADGTAVVIIDQRDLPGRLCERELRTLDDVVDAIMTLAVRGAPLIGIAGAMGLAVVMDGYSAELRPAFNERLEAAAQAIRSARPTAVNLPRALDRMRACARATSGDAKVVTIALRKEADAILADERQMCERIGAFGVQFVPDGSRVLTHCNAGALATGGIGTALAPIYCAVSAGQSVEVFAGETRPLWQGSRLTAWELSRAGIPVTVIGDSMAASLMREGRVDLCLVGADRIAANGDVANKIGTYSLAIAARRHDVPFYVAAPSTSLDVHTATGEGIVIEQREATELTMAGNQRLAPNGVAAYNPAFDVTPADLITAIITDTGIFTAPYDFLREQGG